jgi:hypothetical protein
MGWPVQRREPLQPDARGVEVIAFLRLLVCLGLVALLVIVGAAFLALAMVSL